MTFKVLTELGMVKVTPAFRVSLRVRKEIRDTLRRVVADIRPIEELQEKIKRRHAEAGTPRGALRAYLTAQGWTQAVLSKKTGIPQGNISQMLGGKRPIGPAMAKKFGEVFGVDYRRFL